MPIKSIFASKLDSNKVSLTVESLTKFVIYLAGFYALKKGFDVTTAQTQVQAISDLVISLIPAVMAVYHGAMTVYGLARKVFVQK